jgi:hypothetical protein
MPARSISRCEAISASFGVSRKIGRKKRERRMNSRSFRIALEHDPEKWIPVSALREALPTACPIGQRFGRRRQVGKDHAQTTSQSEMAVQPNPISL